MIAGRAWAEVDVAALTHNVQSIAALVQPAEVWAVVKADGYGHGAVEVARTALAAGASGLAVALTTEGAALRDAGIDAPILILSEQPPADAPKIVAARLTPTVTSRAGVDALALAATGEDRIDVHVKVDTGMHRVGVAPTDVADLLAHVDATERLDVAGLYSHLACADDPRSPANEHQIGAFDAVIADLAARRAVPPLTHLANSAGALALEPARRSLVRLGIAMYGLAPGSGVAHLCSDLRPVMSLHARVSGVRAVAAGSSVSYGWTHQFASATRVATVPIGYADGVPRRLGTLPDRPGADVLIGGRRHPIVGVVTMDQLMVDVGDASVTVGDHVTLIGTQGDQRVSADDWADRLGTINYEIVCGISARVPRVIRGVAPGS